MLAVNAGDDKPEVLREFAEKNGIHYPVLPDGNAVAHQWKVKFIPANFLLDREGRPHGVPSSGPGL